jgi:hypothetical protein
MIQEPPDAVLGDSGCATLAGVGAPQRMIGRDSQPGQVVTADMPLGAGKHPGLGMRRMKPGGGLSRIMALNFRASRGELGRLRTITLARPDANDRTFCEAQLYRICVSVRCTSAASSA